ncbi:MAG: PKD domain-containing protein [Solirubrobacterales bacterium]
MIDIATDQVIGEPIPVGGDPASVAITPDGKRAYVANSADQNVSVIDIATNQVIGEPIPVGNHPHAVAIVPDQPPVASLAAPFGRPGVPIAFSAAPSSDPDGSLARYDWAFGDGETAVGDGPIQNHTYAAPGEYQVTLTLTDDEGCSTSFISTGQTASCNGSPTAAATKTVTVVAPAPAPAAPGEAPLAKPRVRISCPESAKPGGCKIKLQAVSAKPRKAKGGRARKPKTETAVARLKLKAGHASLVTLKPKPRFVAVLAAAKQVLVRETVQIKGSTHTHYRRLKVVR